MCLALYLFTNSELHQSKWNAARPKVYVEMVGAGEDRNVLKWPHEGLNVYYIGSHQGCGCGWSATGEWDEPSDRDAKTEDRLELGRILRVIDLKHSWFVVCWEGDQGESIQPAKTISVDQIEDPQFEFEELQQYRVAQ